MSTMNKVFSDYIDQFMAVFPDEILTYSKTWKENLRHLRKELQRLKKTKFYGKIKNVC